MPWTEIAPVVFLVDKDKHRIVKREGIWRMYCPELNRRNPERNCVYAVSFRHMLLLPTECPHGAGTLFI